MRYVTLLADRLSKSNFFYLDKILFWIRQIKPSRRLSVKESREAVFIQNAYNLEPLKSSQKLTIFLVPPRGRLTGGIISIFKLHEISSEVQKDSLCLLVTYPGFFTRATHGDYESAQQIYRWEQITQYGKQARELIIHIPEYYSAGFYSDLSASDIEFVKSIPLLKINILNQNLLLMPERDKIQTLFRLTNHVTQTVGFERNATQKVCDHYGLPLYAVPSYIDLENCVKKDYSAKRKIILYSPDEHPLKKRVVQHLKSELKGFELREIRNLTYFEFLDLISDALFCISFGEGFDGYYIQPYYAQSIGISVYNEVFFPDAELKAYPFVYGSYEELEQKVVEDVKKYSQNRETYVQVSSKVLSYFQLRINKKSNTSNGLELFYKNRPTFMPK